MADNFKELWSSFKDVTNKTVERNKDTSVVKIVTKTIESLEILINSLDVFLKKKGIDLGKAYSVSKTKSKSLLDKAKEEISRVKSIGVKATALDVTSKLSDKFKGFFDKETGPPEEEETEDNKFTSTLKKVRSTLLGKDPEDMTWQEKAKEREERRRKEIEEEKEAVKRNAKKKDKKSGSNNWLSKILTGIVGLGGSLLNGMKFLGGFVVKGLGLAFTKIIPSLSSGIAKTLSTIIGGGIKGLGKAAWEGVKTVGKRAIPFLGKAAGLVLRGGAMIASGPVGWAVAIGTAIYGGYKLYKYLNRNNVKDDIYGKLTKLRLHMYGFNDIKKEHYSKVFDLEMLMKEFTTFKDYKVEISRLDKDKINKVLDIFGVKREEKDKYTILNRWFMKRFIPAYRAFISALWSINNRIFLDNIDSLKQTELETFITKFNVPTSIYEITDVPTYDDTKTLVSKQDVDTLLINISNEINSKKKNSKTTVQKAAEENKKHVAKKNTIVPETTKPAAYKPEPVKDVAIDQEGENKPKPISDTSNLNSKIQSKLNIAPGELFPGGTDLIGITTNLDKEKIFNLDPNVRELFTGMAKEYNALTGKNIPVNEAFRSYEDQADLYRRMPEKAAKPGNSVHEFGLAVDIDSKIARELNDMGLLRKYGFTTSIGKEDWHIEPIGVSMNPTLAKNDPDFRFKAIEASIGKGGDGYGFMNNSILKKRNIDYQVSIYNSNTDNPVDIEKMKQNTPIMNQGSPTLIQANKNTSPSSISNRRIDVVDINTLNIPKSTVPSTNPNMDLGKYEELDPVTAIKTASNMVGVNENTMINFAKLESSLDPNAKAKTSSASGLFQITDGTWKELINKHGDKYGIDSSVDKNNPFYNSLMGAEYAKENLSKLKNYDQAGVRQDTALYTAHFLGPSGANKVFNQLTKDPNAPVQTAVSESAFKANRSLMEGKTVAGLINTMESKIDRAAGIQTASYRTTTQATPMSTPRPMVNNTSNIQTGYATSVSQTRPSITNSRIDVSSTKSRTPKQNNTPQNTQYSEIFNTNKIEGILTDQLSTLNNIAGILTAMNTNFDLNKLANIITSANKPTETKQNTNQNSNNINRQPTTIDLSRKKITT